MARFQDIFFGIITLLLAFASCSQPSKIDVQPSCSVPVIRLDTRNKAPITSREHWRAGMICVEDSSVELDMLVRGRGNTTWTLSDKKPFRIKLDDPYPLLGLHSSKHFVLLSEATTPFSMLAAIAAFELSRRLDMPFTPEAKPVELVINGEYNGLYLLTEQVRVEPARIDVKRWSRHPSQYLNDTGGWLLEIDGWNTYSRINLPSQLGLTLPIEYHYPKQLDGWQRDYITQLLQRVDSAICTSDKNSRAWEDLVDIDILAKYYIINEVMDNCEAFSGSCWFSKRDMADSKIEFGPVWDFGSAFAHRSIDKPECFIYQEVPKYCSPLWLKELVRFPRFQECVKQHYRQLKAMQGDDLDAVIDDFVRQTHLASQAEAKRWPESPVGHLKENATWVKQYLKRKIQFLDKQWLQ